MGRRRSVKNIAAGNDDREVVNAQDQSVAISNSAVNRLSLNLQLLLSFTSYCETYWRKFSLRSTMYIHPVYFRR